MTTTISLLAFAGHHHHHHSHHAARVATTAADPAARLQHLLNSFAIGSISVLGLALVGVLLGWLVHRHGRYRPSVGVVAALALVWPAALTAAWFNHPNLGAAGAMIVLAAQGMAGFRFDQADRRAGKDRRRCAERRLGLIGVGRAVWTSRHIATAQPNYDELIVGRTATRIVKLVRGWSSGRHVGVLGAPGSGKSTTIAALIEQHAFSTKGGCRHGAVIIDPKGDPAIRQAAVAAAKASGAPFFEFRPQGGVVYDFLAGGDVDRRTDKLLAAEEWTEPHYLAGATTYLREVMRTLEATEQHPTLSKVLALMDPDKHENAAATAGREYAKQLGDYIKSLTPRQRADLTGLRDRLAALGRSDMAQWLDVDRHPDAPLLDLADAVQRKAVVLFTLQADDYPMLSKKLAAAIVLDLIAVAQRHQTLPIPTLVAIDEFGAIDSELVLRLLARARGAGFSVCLAAQTLADFSAASADGSMATRVIGNLNALIAGRMNDAAEAEWIAQVAGTKDSWTTTQRTNLILPASEGTRTLDRDFIVHPDQIKTLRRGQAAVIALDPIPKQRRVEITDVRTPRLA